MNSRERVLAALDRQPVDRTPSDIFGWWPGIRGRLLERTGAEDLDSLRIRLGADVRRAPIAYAGPPLPPAPIEHPDPAHLASDMTISVWGTIGGLESHADGVGVRPLQSAETVREIDAYAWPDPDWFDFAEIPAWARERAEYALWVGGWSPIFSLVADLCGMQTALVNLLLRPDLTAATVRNIHRYYRGYYSRMIRAVRGHVDIIGFGDDFASQQTLLFNPRIWREIFKPVWADLFAIAKENDLRVAFHSCGAVRAIIPDLIEIGLDILFPLQVRATGMDAAELKREFGDRLAFYGGIDTQHTLPFGSAEDVRREVRGRIDTLGRDGGYIVASSHALMNDVPVENVLAMYDEARVHRPS